MPALLVLTYDVVDRGRLMDYRAAANVVLADIELVTSTDRTVHLDEAGSRGSHTVILRFDDVDHALSVYHSEDYQALVPERLAATVPRVAMVVPLPERKPSA